jgi:hypothetical protein
MICSSAADYNCPGANLPGGDQPIFDIRVVVHKVLNDLRIINLEDEHCAINWVGECASDHQFAAGMRSVRGGKVLAAVRCAAFQNVIDIIIK